MSNKIRKQNLFPVISSDLDQNLQKTAPLLVDTGNPFG